MTPTRTESYDCDNLPPNPDPNVVELCEKIRKEGKSSESNQKPPEKVFLGHYLPIVFFTIIATAIGWEIAKNLNTIIYNYFVPIYGVIMSNWISMGFLVIIFFVFLNIGFLLFRNWKSERDFDTEYSRFPH